MKDQYVILTGSKNNAGDYLIKHRAKKLFKELRPDRKIIDFDGWKTFSVNDLKIVNESKALILLGGPALQNEMYPKVYGLCNDLDQITVPIIMMGVGWYSKSGNWENSYNYKLDKKTHQLLEKIATSGFLSSVRDYHTLNTLQNLNINNVLMTGCPALYDIEKINQGTLFENKIKKIGYSLGVSMMTSASMKKQMKQVLLLLKKLFPQADVVTVFHHSIAKEYLTMDGSTNKLYDTHIEFRKWLDHNEFAYEDISGSADKLISFYKSCDLHVGYRVHAHIFMSSISKQSVLLTEDGRGKGLEKVICGNIINGNNYITSNIINGNNYITSNIIIKILNKLGVYDNVKSNKHILKDLEHMFQYELQSGIRFSQPRVEIDRHFLTMSKFLKQLP